MAPSRPAKHNDWGHNCLYGLILIMALALKLHYRAADAAELTWILAPTAMVVEQISGMAFEKEIDSGYLNAARGILIAPACAGVNFMILCFGLGSLAGLRRAAAMVYKLGWIMLMPAVAFALTVMTNALRIILSINCYYWDRLPLGLSAEGLHRVLGTLVYFFCLWLFYMVLHQNWSDGVPCRRYAAPRTVPVRALPPFLKAGLVPLGGYWLVTVIVPVLKAALTGRTRELSGHVCSVVVASLGLFVLLQTIPAAAKLLKRRRRFFLKTRGQQKPSGSAKGRQNVQGGSFETDYSHRRG
jgi:exosortase K